MKKIRICTIIAITAAAMLLLGGCSSVVNMVEKKATEAIGEALGGSDAGGLASTVGNLIGGSDSDGGGLASTVGNLIGGGASDLVGNLLGGGSDDGGDAMILNQEESQAMMQKLAEREGYQLTLRNYTDGEESKQTIGQTRDKWWSISDSGDGSGYVIEDDVYHFYDMYDNEWNYSNSITKGSYGDMAATVSAISSAYLYMGNMYNGLAKKSGTGTVAGRKCDVYSYNMGVEALGYGYSYKIYIDQEYGCTMKLEASATSGADSGEVSYEVIEFVTGSKVKAPSFPKPDSYSVTDMSSGQWPDNEYTRLIPSLPSNFEVGMTSTEDGSFNGMLQNVSEDDARSYIKSVMKKGFGDSDSLQEYDGQLFFEGGNSKDQYVSITYMSGTLLITVSK